MEAYVEQILEVVTIIRLRRRRPRRRRVSLRWTTVRREPDLSEDEEIGAKEKQATNPAPIDLAVTHLLC